MPKDTFLNLPKEKRQLIEEIAIDEFAEQGFEVASISRMVKKAGIAKGSFYQYFEDKTDLFMHLITLVAEKKIDYISPVMTNPSDVDFFTLLEELYRSGLAFAKDHPKESKIGFEVYKNSNSPVFDEVMRESRRMAIAYFDSLLDIGIQRGEVAPDIDKVFISHTLIQLQISMFDYYFDNNYQAGWTDDIMPTVQLMINFIKNGIHAKN